MGGIKGGVRLQHWSRGRNHHAIITLWIDRGANYTGIMRFLDRTSRGILLYTLKGAEIRVFNIKIR